MQYWAHVSRMRFMNPGIHLKLLHADSCAKCFKPRYFLANPVSFNRSVMDHPVKPVP